MRFLTTVWPPSFLSTLIDIFGEPERIEISLFQPDILSEKKEGLVFYPQYTKFVHYRDPKSPIEKDALLETYSEQIASENPEKFIERIIWADSIGKESLFSAEFSPTGFSAELENSPELGKILERLGKEVAELNERPNYSVKIIFPGKRH